MDCDGIPDTGISYTANDLYILSDYLDGYHDGACDMLYLGTQEDSEE